MRSHLLIAAILVVGCHASEQADGVDAASSGSGGPDASLIDGPGIVPDDPCFPNPGAGHRVYSCNGLAFDVEVAARCGAGRCGVNPDRVRPPTRGAPGGR